MAEVEDWFDELDDDVEFVDDDELLVLLVGVDEFVAALDAALAIGLAAMAPTSPVKARPVSAPATRRARAAG